MESQVIKPKKWTKKAIIKTVIVVVTVLLNLVVSLVTFFVLPLSPNLLSGLLLLNASALSLYRNTTPIDHFINTWMSDSKTISVKLNEISSFLHDVNSVKDQLESLHSAREPYSEREAPTPPTKTPRFKANWNKALDTIEITQIPDSPSEQ